MEGVTQIKFVKHHLWVGNIYLRRAIMLPTHDFIPL